MKRDFDTWFGQFRDSIANYRYYTDFEKVIAQAETHKVELYILNSLIGAKDIERQFRELIAEYPSAIRAIPILLAKRGSEIYAKDAEGGGIYRFEEGAQSIDDYCTFMVKTGLFEFISKKYVNNLYEYVIGVEVGLDTNARKNRTGDVMEDLVEGFLKRAGVHYRKEMTSDNLLEEWGMDISPLTNGGEALKKFDFAVKGEKKIYGIETNFYNGGGSKLNETARSYKMLALEAGRTSDFEFVWFTDGAGWKNARKNLRETFDVLPTMFNIKELEDGVMNSLFV